MVVHLAAKAGVRPSLQDPAGYLRVNVAGTQSVLDAARAAGVTRFVFGSSSSVYGDDTPPPFREDAAAVHPISPYAATKRAAELVLEALAPHAGFGRRRSGSSRYMARASGPIWLSTASPGGSAPGSRSPCSGMAAKRGTTPILMTSSVAWSRPWTGPPPPPVGMEIFNLGGNEAVPLTPHDRIRSPSELGVTPRIERAPRQPGDVRHTSADLPSRPGCWGTGPRTSFPDGIRRFVAWFRETHARQ